MAAGSTLSLVGTAVIADEKPKEEESKTPKKDKDMPRHAAKDDMPEEQELMDHDFLLGVIMKRYANEGLTEEMLREIRRDIIIDGFRSKSLAEFPLKNSDEPGFVFSAFRAAEA
ncbi:MAG: hypothetical protein CMJ78_25165 [Planctomycetaceae bacterium]|nr:hypothetical protein [Planctomycetaceae bacterium]